MAVARGNVGSFLEAARDLGPLIRKTAGEGDLNRELPKEVAEAITDGGFFRMLVPRSLGGYEMEYPDYLNVVQAFAEADGSTGWCVNQNSVLPLQSVKIPEATAREIWSDERAVLANGPPMSTEATPVEGGYRLSGSWRFSSGCHHANWMIALVPKNKIGARMGSRSGDDLLLVMRKEKVKLVDVWDVNGLRGTGSFNFEIDNLFVPESYTFDWGAPPWDDGPLYAMPMTLIFCSGFGCVALGVARAALDAAIELGRTKKPEREGALLREKATFQRALGQAEATWRSARAFLFEAAEGAWESVCKSGALTLEERIKIRLASTHAIRTGAQVADMAYNLCGSDAIFEHNPIQRRFQDAHVITQQIQGRMEHYEKAGQFFLGMEPKGEF